MATVITNECINCGACEPECPNTAIYQGGVEWDLDGAKHPAIATDIFYIVPDKCTECVGFYDHEACAAVCPVDCCIPDPNRPETEAVLIERAKALHSDKMFGPEFPSRFQKEGAAPPPEAPSAAPAPAAQPAAPPPPATAAAAPAPAAKPAAPLAAPAPAETALAIPDIDEWEVPIECFSCHGTYAVAFKHFRSGVVFRCPFCTHSYVITTTLHNYLHHRLRDFYERWRREFETFQAKRQQELTAFEERQRRELEAFNASLADASREIKPPGAPRRRAWIFG
jgi:ferredoxin